jgi:[amino group carrier protein]-lysine/ornithine hydrolase
VKTGAGAGAADAGNDVMDAGTDAHDLTTDAGARTFLEAMVRLPSPSGAERAVAEGFVAALAPHADAAFVDEVGNAVAVVGRGPLRVTLLGHLDTVAGAPPVRVENGVLHGRGAVDAKGPAVALAAALARTGGVVRQALELRFIGAVEEEAPGSRGARHATLAYPRPQLLIVGEPSGWDGITLGYKGHLRMRLGAARKGAHGARDEPTASEALVTAWTRLQAWAAEATPYGGAAGEGLFDRLQPALLALDSNHDGLLDRAEGLVGWRLPPAWPPVRLMAAVAELDLGSGLSWAADDGVEAVRSQRDGRLARAFRTAIRGAGGAPRPKVKTGTSDWNVVAPVWGVDTVAYGPGDAALDHTPHERLPLDELDRAVDVLGRALLQLAGAPAPQLAGLRGPTARSSS